MNLSKDFEELFASLNAHRVKVLIAGAYAVAFHARPRFTKDLDLFVGPSPQNATRLLAALTDFGFGSVGLRVEDFSSPGRVVQLGDLPNRVDFMTSIDGVDFAAAWKGRVAGRYGTAEVFYPGQERADPQQGRGRAAAGPPRPRDLGRAPDG